MNEATSISPRADREPGLPAMFGRLRDEIEQVFDDFSLIHPRRGIFQFASPAKFVPALELRDQGDHYAMSLELPGIDQNAIDIECAEGILTIAGEKRSEGERSTDGYLISERSYGSFKRQVALPPDIDADGISANYRDGILELSLKKDAKAAARVRKIPIS